MRDGLAGGATTRLLIAGALLGPLAAGPSWGQAYPPAVDALIARTRAQVRTIDMAAAKADFDANRLGLLVDVREPAEYAEGHLPGAINIPRGQIELRIWAHLGYPQQTDLRRRITLYCGTGVRCLLAAKSLQDLGLRNIVAVDMKITDWRQAGYPLQQE